jgi:predicted dehydrogenase
VRKLRVIVVGVGHLGRVHARFLSKLPGVRLVGVVDPSEAARTAVADACRTAAYTDWRSLDGKFDAAILAAPTTLHHRIGSELLEQGIHCLIEKPLCSTSGEADELIRIARRKQVVLQVGHVERFNPALAPVLPYARDPKYVEATRSAGFSGRSTDVGVVLDLMIHDIDLVLSLVGAPPRDVEALGIAVLGPHEDVAHARLTFDSGCVATLNASRVSPTTTRRMHIWSQEGFSWIDFAGRKSSAVVPSDAIRERRIDVPAMSCEEREALKRDLFTHHLTQQEFDIAACDQILAELDDFVGSIRDGRTPQVTGQHGRDAIAVAERILDKIATHPWDGALGGRTGPLAAPRADIIPAPHFRTPAAVPWQRKEAV